MRVWIQRNVRYCPGVLPGGFAEFTRKERSKIATVLYALQIGLMRNIFSRTTLSRWTRMQQWTLHNLNWQVPTPSKEGINDQLTLPGLQQIPFKRKEMAVPRKTEEEREHKTFTRFFFYFVHFFFLSLLSFVPFHFTSPFIISFLSYPSYISSLSFVLTFR